MRLLVLILLVFFVAAGVVVGALNADLVGYDLAFMQVRLPKGAALLGGVGVGWMLGGITAWMGLSSGHRRQRQKQQQAEKKLTAKT
jgi:putative membrane protein